MDTLKFLTNVLEESWKKVNCPQRVLVAFSGGADSTALLCALVGLAKNYPSRLTLSAAHINHHLRAESDGDAASAKALCEKLGVPLFQADLSLESHSEEEARKARYRALLSICKDASAQVIALGHHAQDQAETVLMRMMRGAAEGLMGMRMWSAPFPGVQVSLWRPFLHIPPQTLRNALSEGDIPWREDASNADTHYLRNYIRHVLLPSMRSRAPQVERHLCRSALIVEEENHYFQTLVDPWLRKHACTRGPCLFLQGASFDRLHPALQKRVLKAFWSACGTDSMLNYDQITCAATLSPGCSVNWPDGHVLTRTHKYIHLRSPRIFSFNLGKLLVLPFEGEYGDGIHTQSIPKSVLNNSSLRTWQPGDSIQPFGMAGRKSLQDYLTDRKIDQPFRNHLPLLCCGSEVLWVIGVGVSEKLRAANDDELLLLHYPDRLIFELPDENTKEN